MKAQQKKKRIREVTVQALGSQMPASRAAKEGRGIRHLTNVIQQERIVNLKYTRIWIKFMLRGSQTI